jgi:hypothetical protein
MRNGRVLSFQDFLLLVLGLSVGGGLAACRGCSKTSAPAAAVEVESRHNRLMARIADLKIDRSRVYPKDANGVVPCGDDMHCFVLQGETCTRAEVTHKLTISGYGIHNVVDATYTILGSEADRCRMRRRVRSADSHIDQNMIDALRADGKTEMDIARYQTEASTRLRKDTPLQLDCWFMNEDVLEIALDLTDQRSNDKLLQVGCHQSDENSTATPDDTPAAAPADAATALPAEPAEKPAAKTKAEKAAAKTKAQKPALKPASEPAANPAPAPATK